MSNMKVLLLRKKFKETLSFLALHKWFVLVLVAIVFYFYWNDIRPTRIKQFCYQTMEEYFEYRKEGIKKFLDEHPMRDDELKTLDSDFDKEANYQSCLRLKGL